jgi:hypothetical protein
VSFILTVANEPNIPNVVRLIVVAPLIFKCPNVANFWCHDIHPNDTKQDSYLIFKKGFTKKLFFSTLSLTVLQIKNVTEIRSSSHF